MRNGRESGEELQIEIHNPRPSAESTHLARYSFLLLLPSLLVTKSEWLLPLLTGLLLLLLLLQHNKICQDFIRVIGIHISMHNNPPSHLLGMSAASNLLFDSLTLKMFVQNTISSRQQPVSQLSVYQVVSIVYDWMGGGLRVRHRDSCRYAGNMDCLLSSPHTWGEEEGLSDKWINEQTWRQDNKWNPSLVLLIISIGLDCLRVTQIPILCKLM